MTRPARGHSHPVSHPGTHGHLHVPGTSPLHLLNAAPKLVGLFVFVIVVVATPGRDWAALALDGLLMISLLCWVRVPIRSVASRGLILLPILIFACLLPFAGDGPRTTIGPFSLSTAGLWSAWNVAAKATIGVLAGIALTATTSVSDIIVGLSRLHLPRLIVAIVAFMFRYLDLIDDRLTKMHQAMTARCYDPRWLWQTKPIAQSAGTLFVRTYEQGERIHQAMLARGYNGTMPDIGNEPIARRQWLVALVPAGCAAGAWLIANALSG